MLLLVSWYLKQRNRKVSRILNVVAACWFFICWISPVPMLLARSLENDYPALNQDIKHERVDIIVLGSGYTLDPALSATNQLGSGALLRLTEGVRVYRKVKNARFITSGHSNTTHRSQAEVASLAALELGIAPRDTAMLTTTVNTRDEAANYAARFGVEGRKVIVVTDAIHMPRAMRWFQHYGANAIAAPTHYKIKNDPAKGINWWKPSIIKLEMMKSGMKEYLGLFYFELTT